MKKYKFTAENETNLDPRFAQTEYAIEGDSALVWEKFSKLLPWEQHTCGVWYKIGTFHKEPINLHFDWVTFNGHLIVFYNRAHTVMHYGLIEEWLNRHCCTRQGSISNFFHEAYTYCAESPGKYLKKFSTFRASRSDRGLSRDGWEDGWGDNCLTKEQSHEVYKELILRKMPPLISRNGEIPTS